ncbi:MAG: HAD family hydrolase [Clostridiales bacterium]|nr:HAD family hydrolase [Clostridiales bacterium]
MKNILFMTDLDGTLLNDKKEITKKSADILNSLTEKGLKLSISTARTPATLEGILSGLKLSYPLCCMNGAAIYDMKKEKYIRFYPLKSEFVYRLIEICRQVGISPFIHIIKDNRLYVCYENTESKAAEDFHREREGLRLKTYIHAPYSPNFGEAVYFTLLAEERKIREILAEIEREGLSKALGLNFYGDIYNKGFYYLEICDKMASKKTGLHFLKEYSGAEEVYAFGDNLNDLPMLEEADLCFAVENAVDEVKNFCHRVIGKNTEDSVALTIKNITEDEF